MKCIRGDIFESNADAILHQVNCQGVMGAGLAKQVKDKYPAVFKYYKALCDEDKRSRAQLGWSKSGLLGYMQVCYKEDYLVGQEKDKQVVVNLFAQDRYGNDGRCYTDYDALRRCLEKVNARFAGETVAIPYGMGCGLAGGDWGIVSKMIQDTLVNCDVTFYEYDKSLENRREAQKTAKDNFPPGTRVLATRIGDPYGSAVSMRGTVRFVDKDNCVQIAFDNGRYIGLLPGLDNFRPLTAAELEEEKLIVETVIKDASKRVNKSKTISLEKDIEVF